MSKSPLVMLVEDDPWMAAHHGRSLEEAGYAVVAVSHALSAIDEIDARKPDVIVLDMMLPGPNAITLLHELQSHVDLAQIPIILCTNSADVLADEDKALYGIQEVLDKATMLPEDVVVMVKRALG